MVRRVLAILALTLGLIFGSVLIAGPAEAATKITFSNSGSNKGSFDCYTYSSSKWHKINDGHSRTVTKNTPFKCDHSYRVYNLLKTTRTKVIEKNKAYRLGDFNVGAFSWVVAYQE